jgi:ABC-type Zn uptake system ZnuABC Zn-binding protein ZnuA
LAVAALAVVGCSDDGDDDASTDAPLVVVPNTILAELVQRVACVGEVRTVVASDPAASEDDPIALITLETPDRAPAPPTADTIVISVPESVTTVDTIDGPDAWVWTDPIRYAELSTTVGALLAGRPEFDAEIVDRCLARIDAEMELLDVELFDEVGVVDDRTIDIAEPGVVYFASRYEFAPGDSDEATAAGRTVSVDDLGDATSYEELMRRVVADVVATLG